ncbi:MAG TPA: hypothetical protein VEL76_29275 [Gemmataceae bacterium]|nr:hypothetical protein [Gemmataceae bacterium]
MSVLYHGKSGSVWLDALKNPNERARLKAIAVLIAVGQPAVPPLGKALHRSAPLVREGPPPRFGGWVALARPPSRHWPALWRMTTIWCGGLLSRHSAR